MRIPFGVAALLLAAGIARADVVIIQQIDGMAQSGQMTIMVNGDKVRADVSPQISTITDATTGDVTTLMHAQKCYIVISAAAGKAMLAGVTAPQPGAPASPAPPVLPMQAPSPKATGKTDKINGYNAAEYTFTNGNMKGTYWICSDFPNAKLVTDALAKFQKGGLASIAKGLAPDLGAFHGVPVKTEIDINGQKITTQLISANEQPVDPDEYKVPAGYTEMKMPPMDGPGIDF
jgi:hypothetical protein